MNGWVSYVPLVGGGYAIVDLLDYEKVEGFRWHRHPEGYAHACVKRDGKWISLLMHRLLTGVSNGSIIDHTNGNGLDNRRKNLRVCSRAENDANADIWETNTSGYKGVSYYRSTGKWRVAFGVQGKSYYVGYYDTKEEAALAYNIVAFGLYGEFARLNKVPGFSNAILYQIYEKDCPTK